MIRLHRPLSAPNWRGTGAEPGALWRPGRRHLPAGRGAAPAGAPERLLGRRPPVRNRVPIWVRTTSSNQVDRKTSSGTPVASWSSCWLGGVRERTAPKMTSSAYQFPLWITKEIKEGAVTKRGAYAGSRPGTQRFIAPGIPALLSLHGGLRARGHLHAIGANLDGPLGQFGDQFCHVPHLNG